MTDLKLGINLWSQQTSWADFLDAAQRIDRLGYDSLWTWDHIHAIFGDPQQPIFEGYATLGAWAMATEHIKIGLMVGANTFRNPGLVVKSITTLDHISGGRAILGIGGAWFEYEHTAHGIEFGKSVGERLDWLDDAVAAMRTFLDGGTVTSKPGSRYHFQDLHHVPDPVQAHVPILIGGNGRNKTLRTIARYADQWNGFGTPDEIGELTASSPATWPRKAGQRRDRAHGQHLDGHPRRPGRGAPGLGVADGVQHRAADEPEIARGRPILGTSSRSRPVSANTWTRASRPRSSNCPRRSITRRSSA